MLFHDVTSSVKFILRNKAFSALNIIGLTLGIFSCLLIILYIHSELTYDRFHKSGDRIYRVVMHQPGNQVSGSSTDWWVVSPFILKPTWENELPEVDLVARTTNRRWNFKLDNQFINEQVMIVDPEFLEIFSFPLSKGSISRALWDPFSIILTREMALKYFGAEEALGEIMVLNNGRELTVTGILEDIPGNSHLQFDFLVSFQTLEAIMERSLLSDDWLNNGYRTYLTLHGNSDPELLDAKLRAYDIKGFNGNTWTFHLQPLHDIHFNRQITGTGDKGSLFIFVTAGIFILFIACFNYLNLYVAYYRTRIKNVSLRKLFGARRSLLMRQYFSESLVLVVISYLLAMGVIRLILPLFNATLEQHLDYRSIWNPLVMLVSLGLILFMAFISGFYPAAYLSRLKVTEALRGGIKKLSRSGQQFRKAIVIIQFSVSIALIIGSATIIKQLIYTRHVDLGFQKENIIYLDLMNYLFTKEFTLAENMESFKQELLRHPNIRTVALSTGIPTDIGWSNMPVWEGQQDGDRPFFYRMIVDYDFLELYQIPLESGRYFSKAMGSDDGNAYIINRAAADRMGFQTTVGSEFGFDDQLGTVIGLTEDFYFESLHKPITPIGIGVKDEYYWHYISIEILPSGIQGTIETIEKTWKSYVPELPINYTFFDARLDQLYRKDRQISKSINYLSLMALLISCLGVFGLMSLSLRERTREIGIRKVLGATFARLYGLLTREFLFLILCASVLGATLGWILSKEWLQNFAYRCRFGADIIVISVAMTLVISMGILSLKLVQSIHTNPAESLRTE